MNLKLRHWAAIGLIVATSAASLVLAGAGLNGFSTAPSNSVMVTAFGQANLNLILMGALLLSAMEVLHVRGLHKGGLHVRRQQVPIHDARRPHGNTQSMTATGAIVRI